MAKKREVQVIHPRRAIEAIQGFHDDVGALMTVVRSAVGFLRDDSLDPEKVRKVIADQLDESAQKAARWFDAE